MRFGAWLACLAFVTQFVVSILPMAPANAAGFGLDGFSVICSTDYVANPVSGHPVKPPPHKMTDCVVCLAHYIMGSALPPALPVIVSPSHTDRSVFTWARHGFAVRSVHRAQQVRAPPILA